jgi:hypothetical protein
MHPTDAKILIQQDWHGLFHTQRTIIYHHLHLLSGDDGMDEQQIDWCSGCRTKNPWTSMPTNTSAHSSLTARTTSPRGCLNVLPSASTICIGTS